MRVQGLEFVIGSRRILLEHASFSPPLTLFGSDLVVLYFISLLSFSVGGE